MKTFLIISGLVVAVFAAGFIAGYFFSRNSGKKLEEKARAEAAEYKAKYDGLVKQIQEKAAMIKEKI